MFCYFFVSRFCFVLFILHINFYFNSNENCIKNVRSFTSFQIFRYSFFFNSLSNERRRKTTEEVKNRINGPIRSNLTLMNCSRNRKKNSYAQTYTKWCNNNQTNDNHSSFLCVCAWIHLYAYVLLLLLLFILSFWFSLFSALLSTSSYTTSPPIYVYQFNKKKTKIFVHTVVVGTFLFVCKRMHACTHNPMHTLLSV